MNAYTRYCSYPNREEQSSGTIGAGDAELGQSPIPHLGLAFPKRSSREHARQTGTLPSAPWNSKRLWNSSLETTA